jgi:hypothetical protein
VAATAFQTQYRQEFIAGFEQRQALLRDTVTTEAEVKGNTATFLIADSGDATATTRGVDGLITPRNDDLTQTSATLVEWHDLVRKSNFNVESSQGNQRAIMQQTSMAVVNRKIDSDILTCLLTGTVTWGAATTASLAAVMVALTKLGNAAVPLDGNISAVISPAFHAYLAQTKEFASVEYINAKPTDGNDLAWRDRPMNYRWQGVNWIVHPNISGKATAAERCFLYHKSAIGHAVHSESIEAVAGYDEEQAYSYARTSIHMGSALLQNTGVIEMTHDGSAFA